MKSILLLLLVAPFALFGQSKYAKLDEKFGYKDLKFEMSETDFASKVKNRKLESKEEGLTKYLITDIGYQKVGSCELETVVATFFEKQLLSIDIKTKGSVNSGCFYDAIVSQFGKGFQSNKYIEEYGWIGEKVFALFSKNSVTDDGDFYMCGSSISDRYDQFTKNSGTKNGKEF